MHSAPDIFSFRKHWAHKLGTAPELPMTRAEMDLLGWDSCDIVIVTGDAYVDHPSFGMAIIGRLLEAQGFRVGIIAQPDWTSAEPLRALGRPNLFFGVTAGNMDSMVNRYTSDRRMRSDDAYSPDGQGGQRPDRAVVVYAQRAREAFKDVPVVIGGIEASLRRIAHYDYWSDKVRRSVLLDAKADLLVYGNAERAVVELAHRLARDEPIDSIRDIRGTGFMRRGTARGLDRDRLHRCGPARPHRAASGPLSGRAVDGGDAAPRHAKTPPPMQGRPRNPSSSTVTRRADHRGWIGSEPMSACHPTSRCATTRCCTPTPRGCCTWRPTPATPARWCSATATASCG